MAGEYSGVLSRLRIHINKISRFLHAILLCWLLISLVVFMLAAAASAIPMGSFVPWSAVDDVTVGAGGRGYVYSSLWGRLLCFEPNGESCGGKLLLDGKGLMQLASTESGLLVAFKANRVCTAQEPDFENWDCWRLDLSQSSCLVLDRAGKIPRAVSFESQDPGWTVMVPEGTPLFCPPRQTGSSPFFNPFGSITRIGPRTEVRLSRVAASSEVLDRDGRVLYRFKSPWYLYWLGFPFPSMTPWILLIAAEIVQRRWSRRKIEGSRRSAEERPAWLRRQ